MVAEHGCPRDRGVWPPQEQIPEKICEQIADVHMPQVVEQTIEVPKMAEQILDVPVPEMVEQLVEVPETVSRDGVQQLTVEQIVDAPVLKAVEELTEVFRVFSQDRTQERTVKQINPAIPLAEKIVELPVIQTEEKTRQGVNACVQHVANAGLSVRALGNRKLVLVHQTQRSRVPVAFLVPSPPRHSTPSVCLNKDRLADWWKYLNTTMRLYCWSDDGGDSFITKFLMTSQRFSPYGEGLSRELENLDMSI